MTVVSINPTTGETLETFAETTPAALERVLDEAVAAYQTWRRCSYAHSAKLVREAARMLRERKSQHARTMALEMGKPLPQGEAEAEKCAWVCDYYAEHAERFLADEPRETDASKAFVRFDPIGPVLAIMPWNFPFWQVFRFAARSEEHTSELQSQSNLVCRLLLAKKTSRFKTLAPRHVNILRS